MPKTRFGDYEWAPCRRPSPNHPGLACSFPLYFREPRVIFKPCHAMGSGKSKDNDQPDENNDDDDPLLTAIPTSKLVRMDSPEMKNAMP